jgi:hypothetical protein
MLTYSPNQLRKVTASSTAAAVKMESDAASSPKPMEQLEKEDKIGTPQKQLLIQMAEGLAKRRNSRQSRGRIFGMRRRRMTMRQ